MSLHRYLERIRRTDALIRRKSTGPPSELASRLDISERWLYVFLNEMQQELGCPITYCRQSRSYMYSRDGVVTIGFRTPCCKALTQEPENKFRETRK